MADSVVCVGDEVSFTDETGEQEDEEELKSNSGDELDSLSSDDDASSLDDDALVKEIEADEAMLVANPFLYDQHVSIIGKLKKIGDLEKLRKARERMASTFPLTGELWLDWIRDEIKLATSDEEKDAVLSLLERAVKDYLSVDVWLEYVQFSIGRMGCIEGIEKCRDVFEQAIVAAGLHVSKGSLLWEAYIEFENVVLSLMQPSLGATISESQQKEIKQQEEKITSLFKRQLSVPLLDMEKTYEEFKEWVTDHKIDANVDFSYNRALAKLKKIYSFEEALISTENSSESTFMDYINFELKENEPTRIICLYERAIVETCLSSSLWEQYANYLTTQLKIGTVVLPVYERAIRNCPWSLNLWLSYLRSLERYNEPREKIKDTAERALGSGFTLASDFQTLWMAYLEYLRRQIDWTQEHSESVELLRTIFQTAHNHLMDGFGYEGDRDCTILQYWARVEALCCKNMKRAREIWNDILHLGHMNSSKMWLEFCNLERLHGDKSHLRKLFLRALQATSDLPEAVGEAWLNFERDEGSLEQFETASSKIESRMKIIKEWRQKEVEENALNEKVETVKKNKASLKRLSDRVTVNNKRKKFEDSASGDCVAPKVDKEGFKVPKPLAASNKEYLRTESAKRKQIGEYLSSHADLDKYDDEAKDERTVFLSNLSYDVDESRIREFFSENGEIKEIRLVRNFSGRSKGYCYVEFAKKDLAVKALSKDRTPIDGRPTFVSKCQSKEKRQKEKVPYYNLGEEKNKLYVRNLPTTITQAAVTDLFKQFGKVKDVRLVTYRNGHFKGFAFVDYHDNASAALAVEKLNGTTVEGREIFVAVSNPSECKGSGAPVPDKGGSVATVQSMSRKSRTQLSLLPRVFTKAGQQPSTSAANGSGDVKKPLSNDDFRKLFAKK